MSWIDQFLTAIGYVQNDGTPLIQRPTINFALPPGGSVVDDPSTKVTTVTIPAASGGTGTVTAKLVATSSIILSGSQTIDGVTASPGDVVLAAGQTGGSENGLWIVASGVWSRTADAITRGMAVFIQQGTSNTGAVFTLLGSGPIVVGTTPLVFANLNSVFDVRLFGAVADATGVANVGTDVGPPMRLAAAAAKAAGYGAIFLPVGRFIMKTAVSSVGVLLDFDNVRIVGAGSGKTIIYMIDTCDFFPIVFQKWSTELEPQELVNGDTVGFTILFLGTGPAPAGSGIQFNHVTGGLCSDVQLIGDGLGMGGGQGTDGFAYARDSLDCVIENCLTDGLSKNGFYGADCTNLTVRACTARNHKSTYFGEGVGGFQIGNSVGGSYDVTSYGHDGCGGYVNGEGAIDCTISAFTDSQHFVIDYGVGQSQGPTVTSRLAVKNTTTKRLEVLDVASVTSADAGVGRLWTIVLATAPAQTLSNGMALKADVRPPLDNDITVNAYDNGHDGIQFGSSEGGLTLINTTVRGSLHDNANYGINCSGVDGLEVHATIYGNASGAVFTDVGPNADFENMTGNIKLSGRVYDNTNYGVYLASVNNFEIGNDLVVSRSDPSLQTVGLAVVSLTVITTNKKCAGLRIGRFSYPGYSTNPLQIGSSTDAPTDGLFDYDSTGSPEGTQFSPIGSKYLDAASGQLYLKSTDGTLATGWLRVFRTDDATTAATASLLALRDNNADIFARQFHGSRVDNASGQLQVFSSGSNSVSIGNDSSGPRIDVGSALCTIVTPIAVTGNSTITGSLDMASNRIVNVTDPSSAQDAATKAYVDLRALEVGSATINDPGTIIAAGGHADFTGTVTGAVVGDSVITNPSTTPDGGVFWCTWVSAPDTVTVRVGSVLGLTTGSTNYAVKVLR